jgi:vacuolar iron transporter family protein
MRHRERHRTEQTGWLRAAVMGANDGIVSTASLLIGVAAAGGTRESLLIAGSASLVAGAMSMAAGEYVSVSSQADTEHADLERERSELSTDIESERNELANIYVGRGLEPTLARTVAEQLMARDALGAHARDELGLTPTLRARPLQAATASSLTFGTGAALPLLTALLVPHQHVVMIVPAASLLLLTTLGAVAARAGGASPLRGALRVGFWSMLAMALTAAVGALIGVRD